MPPAPISQATWDNFVANVSGRSFLQSWSWGELQRTLGVRYWRLTEERGGRLVAAALVIRRSLPFGQCYLYVPRGPVVVLGTADVSTGHQAEKDNEAIVAQIIELAREQGAIFIHVEPPFARLSSRSSMFSNHPWRTSSLSIQPTHTLILDLRKSAVELLAAMHPKTRYNIRLAERHGVRVRFSREPRDLESFLKLADEVESRGQFHYHPPGYYRAILTTLGSGRAAVDQLRTRTIPTPGVRMATTELALAEYKGKPLAVGLVISFGDTVTYTHGASSHRRRDLMAPHLLQWEAIRRAKADGFRRYDFYGIAPQGGGEAATAGQAAHPWTGITRFKLGFGGERLAYPVPMDCILSRRYFAAYRWVKTVLA